MKRQNFIARLLCSLGSDIATPERTASSLNRTIINTQKNILNIDIKKDKFIFFSDLHRGARNKADDFQKCEAAYCAALAYYFEMGHTLCVLGDVEELWEEFPAAVIKQYKSSFAEEKRFHDQGRYLRIWGNHDEVWGKSKTDRELLQSQYGEKPLIVEESILLNARNGKKELGKIFLVHGHQGTQNEGGNTEFSKWVLYNIWRPIQIITGTYCSTPAINWELRNKREKMLYDWALTQKSLILIAGHTHAPVFASRSHRLRLTEDLKAARERLSKLSPGQTKKLMDEQTTIAKLSAELELLEHKFSEDEKKAQLLENPAPCYFNTGCCSFADGDITGIEITDGEIRLVRWPDDNDQPIGKVLQSESLVKIFQQLR